MKSVDTIGKVPLQLVLSTYWGEWKGVRKLVEALQCGHVQPVKQDKFGRPTKTYRRKCWKCTQKANRANQSKRSE